MMWKTFASIFVLMTSSSSFAVVPLSQLATPFAERKVLSIASLGWMDRLAKEAQELGEVLVLERTREPVRALGNAFENYARTLEDLAHQLRLERPERGPFWRDRFEAYSYWFRRIVDEAIDSSEDHDLDQFFAARHLADRIDHQFREMIDIFFQSEAEAELAVMDLSQSARSEVTTKGDITGAHWAARIDFDDTDPASTLREIQEALTK